MVVVGVVGVEQQWRQQQHQPDGARIAELHGVAQRRCTIVGLHADMK